MPRLVALASLPMSASSEALACKLTLPRSPAAQQFLRWVRQADFSHKDWKREPPPNLQKMIFFFSLSAKPGWFSNDRLYSLTPSVMLTEATPAQSVAFTAFRCSLGAVQTGSQAACGYRETNWSCCPLLVSLGF